MPQRLLGPRCGVGRRDFGPFARKSAAQLAPITPVPIMAMRLIGRFIEVVPLFQRRDSVCLTGSYTKALSPVTALPTIRFCI